MRSVTRLLSAVCCISLAYPPLPLQAPAETSPRPNYRSTQLQGDQRILHALSRFTFGPRPGDVEAVRKIGLEKWFDQQLHPDTIDETDLRVRLAQFPAMQWTPAELMYRAPSNALIRQALDGRLAIPERGALRAIYEAQMYRVRKRREAQQEKKASPNDTAPGQTMQPSTDSQAPQQTATDFDGNPMSATAASTAPAADDTQFRQLLALAPQERIAHLVAMRPEVIDPFFKSLRPVQRAALLQDLTPDLREVVLDLEGPQRLVNEELIAQRLTRDIYSNAQVHEVMTDFWLNHFNVFIHKNEAMPYDLLSFERDVIRPRALGRFEDLLEATAHSPAMLLYLDNATSIGPKSLAAERAAFRPNAKKRSEGLNENYARELMELHTLGVNGGYTQADVTQVARILTGWTVDRPQRGGGFEFDPRRHEPGTKLVMGRKFKERGEQEGRDLLHMLATQPATAQFISRKLAIRFVSDDPPHPLIDRMAKTFLTTNGDIAAVLTSMFHTPEFWDSNVYRAKVKTPIELVVSAARASNADSSNMLPLANALRAMGMPLYGCVTPNGYSWNADAWVSTNALVNRMNFALAFAANRLPGIAIQWDATQTASNNSAAWETSPNMPDPAGEEARLETVLLVGGASDTTRSAVLQQFEQQRDQIQSGPAPMTVAASDRQKLRDRAASQSERQDQLLAGLLMGSPEFQRR